MARRQKRQRVISLRRATKTTHEPDCRIIFVAPQRAPAVPCYTYTQGLMEALRHPELVVFGLEEGNAADILRDLVSRIATLRQRIKPNHLYTDVLLGHRTVFRELTQNQTFRYLRRTDKKGHVLKALQMVWPDTNDRFPWEAGFEENLRQLQPLLGLDA